MEEQKKIELLREEYFHLQKIVEEFDSKSIAIKTWSVTGSLAVIAAGLIEEINANKVNASPYIFLIGAIASLLFWLIEVYWKTFQLGYYGRINEIEKWFREDEKSNITPFQISKSWNEHWRIRRKNLFRIFKWPHVALPHAAIFLIGCTLFALKMNWFNCE